MPKQHQQGPVSRCLKGGAVVLGLRCPVWLKHPLQAVCAMLVLFAYPAAAYGTVDKSAQVHLAVSSNVPLTSISQKELAAIFLGQKRQWQDGTRVKIAILRSASEQSRFLNVVAGRSPGQYWAHWRNIVFSGRGIMPKIFGSEKEILDYLAQEEGAIGHITSTELADRTGAATLTIDGVMKP